MALLMGIDLGTSSLKVLVVNENGQVVASGSKDYQFDSPAPGYAEQDPEVWWDACKSSINSIVAQQRFDLAEIVGISFSGQMHGVVPLDQKLKPVRPAILHCDGRTGKQVDEITSVLGTEYISAQLMNPVYTGFLLPSLIWIKEKEPELFGRINKVVLPKDYIRLMLTGTIGTDYSDASATLAFDQTKFNWNYELLEKFGLPKDIFPECTESTTIIGTVTGAASAETGLPEGIPVVAGGADQVMQGVGSGAIGLHEATVNIGTSGQVCFQSESPKQSTMLNTNTFIGYKRGRWITMGATMSAGLSMKWFNNNFINKDFQTINEEVEKILPGSEGLLFLPYLNGERTPHINPDLSAVFMGLNLRTGPYHLARAVMEGVAYSLMQCVDSCTALGLEADRFIASGGGARSKPWMQLVSDIFNKPLKIAFVEEQASLGAAIIAGVGVNLYPDIETACNQMVTYREEIFYPSITRHRKYMEYYQLFKDAYEYSSPVIEKLTVTGRRKQ